MNGLANPETWASLRSTVEQIAKDRDFNFRRWLDCADMYAQLQKRFHELTETEAAHLRYLRREQEEVDQLTSRLEAASETLEAEREFITATFPYLYGPGTAYGPRAVAVMLVRHNLDVYVARRNETEKVYPGAWECCTGRVEPGQTIVQTALRELEEECGYKAGNVDGMIADRLQPVGVIHLGDNAPAGRVTLHLFRVDLVDGDQDPRHMEPQHRASWYRVGRDDEPLDKIAPATRTLLSTIWADNKLW